MCVYLGWLCGHFDASLQYGDREFWVRGRTKPQSEVWMRVLYLQLLYQFIQLRHPRQGQVAVSQEHPVTCHMHTSTHTVWMRDKSVKGRSMRC